MKSVYEVLIQHDYETSERAGAGGMFQVISCTGILENEESMPFEVDHGIHYFKNEDFVEDLKKDYPDYDFSKAEIENDD